MENITKLHLVKLVHSLIWLIMVFACFYILYAGVMNVETTLLWICVLLLVGEAIVLLLNKWVCPLTPMARKYSDGQSNNFDIYLPEYIAKYNKMIFGAIFIVGLLLVILNKINST